MRTSIVVTVGAVVAASLAFAGQAMASSPDHHRHGRFTVVERALTDTTADTGPAGDSLGDVLAFANPIFNAKNTHKVGTDNGSCVPTAGGSGQAGLWGTSAPAGS